MGAFWRWSLVLVMLVGVLVAAVSGWIPREWAVDAAMGALALAGLFVVLRGPWDLYFAARAVRVEQDESLARGIAVAPDERASAARIASRLLILCVSLHLGAAALLALAAWMTGGALGYAFATFYLVSTVFRPIEASYRHLAARLGALRERALHPREDILAWVEAVRELEATKVRHAGELEALAERAREAEERTLAALREVEERSRAHDRALDLKLDRLLDELDRTVERMTEDRELVAGLRALAKLIRHAAP